ncbi:MAG: nucleoside deaminase [Bauldia sp.]|nr:nucleoside deaminase [Bauldia sp.]
MRETFMRRAIELARIHMHNKDGGPFGAVIVQDGEIIAEGWNEVASTNDPTAHAEVMAIRRACRRIGSFELRGAELYTTCEPCPMCLAAAYWARVGTIYCASTREDAAAHQFDDDLIYREIALPIPERTIPMVMEVLRPEAQAVFDEWDRMPDKVRY